MSTSSAFDLALFVPPPANVQDGVVVDTLGPPFTTKFKPVVLGSKPGLTISANLPAATGPDQILLSSSSAGFPWALGTNPAAAASVPPPTAPNQLLMSDGTPSWQTSNIGAVLTFGGAVLTSTGGTFSPGANLVFTATAMLATRLNGGDPNFSLIDNFTLDMGTF
jgi:hypothetical protein